MKLKIILTAGIFLIFAVKPEKLAIDQFTKLLFDLNEYNSPVEIYLEGKTEKSRLSFQKYFYYEIINRDSDGSYSVDYVYERSFNILWKKYRIEINRRNIRTFLEPTFFQNQPNNTIFIEYGLQPRKKYFLLPHVDTYSIPGENGDIIEKNNIVFYISDKPFIENKPSVSITPAYQGWTY